MKNLKNLINYGNNVILFWDDIKKSRTLKVFCLLALIWLGFVRGKDISFTITSNNPSQKKEVIEPKINEKTTRTISEKSVVTEPKKPLKTKKKKENKPEVPKVPANASNYSNLGFVLNPNYAKRNNVDPKIVAYKNQICMDYVKRFAPVAVTEMKKYGVPASITLAQGLLESNAGQSKLAINNKNHFGIKCFSTNCKKGHCSNHSDDSHKDFFRNYDSAWASFRAHSLFLQRNRYQHLLKLPKTDYKGWARGLSKAGYASDKKYAPKLIEIIENMDLDEYDK